MCSDALPAAMLPADSETEGDDAFVVRVSGLNKCYQIYDKPSHRLWQMFSRGRRQHYSEFWALRGVSFAIRKGETVGIVGRNGSGKSTLLQLICGTLNPTGGDVQVNGRIAALLELGSGFNPEFTGRENIYLNAAVLGLSKDEVAAKYSRIAEFADIGQFIDQPVKTYSSGMAVRLAFAVAIHADPQILVVDEALSVGDELFQRKCFSRIETLKAQGTTILFVSHAGNLVVQLCDRALLMDAGELLAVGTPKAIIGQYQQLLYAPAEKRAQIRASIAASLASSPSADAGLSTLPEVIEEFLDAGLTSSCLVETEPSGAHIQPPRITTLQGQPVNSLVRGRSYLYHYQVHFSRSATQVRFGTVIKTKSGMPLGGALSVSSRDRTIAYVNAGSQVEVQFRFDCLLNPGLYFMNAGVFGSQDEEETVLHRLIDALVFRVLPVQHNIVTEIIDFGFSPKVTINE